LGFVAIPESPDSVSENIIFGDIRIDKGAVTHYIRCRTASNVVICGAEFPLIQCSEVAQSERRRPHVG
jgi:hypothetical protein